MASILVIDDEESIRYTFRTFLEQEGHQVRTAANYLDGMENVRASIPDLVFVDIILGGKTGIDLLNELRRRGVQCPVIVVTGEPSVETAAECVRLGAFDYLSKPVKKELLLRACQRALTNSAIIRERERYRVNLEAIFRSVQDGIIAIDHLRKITQNNEALSSICKLPSGNIVGKEITEIFTNRYHPILPIVEETLHVKKPLKRQVEINSDDQAQTLVVSGAPLLGEEGHFLGAVMVIRDITRLKTLERELSERQRFHNIIGRSKPMQDIFRLLEDLSDYNTTVLITGESGTGKERVAEALHYGGNREKKPFVKVNCSALAENLLESELFGHVKGAFTGAIKDKVGRFYLANGGTIFLDEIGDISARIQMKLLRVLQEKEFERVGSSQPVKVEVRVIAATNKNLKELVKKGRFREDLYYRLKVVELRIPPLRERIADIPLLVDHFCERFSKKFGKNLLGVSDDVLQFFTSYSWPGNVRELEHALEHAFVLCRTSQIQCDNLPSDMRDTFVDRKPEGQNNEEWERAELLKVLDKTDWNKAKAARVLGISRKTIYRKIEKFQIDDPVG